MNMEVLALIASIGAEVGTGYALARHYGIPVRPLLVSIFVASAAGAVAGIAVGMIVRRAK